MESNEIVQRILQIGLVLLFAVSLWVMNWFYTQKSLIETAITLENQVILGEQIQKAKTGKQKTWYFRIDTPMNQDRANELASRFGGCTITVQGPIVQGQLIRVALH